MTMQLPKGDDESIYEEESSEPVESPTEIMERRLHEMLEETLPHLDKADFGQKRQFAPEFS